MLKLNIKNFFLNFSVLIILFILDRLSKSYIIHLAEINGFVDIYISSLLNLYLTWNKGVAFGLFSFDQNYIYNLITFLIILISFIIFVIIIKTNNYNVYFYLLILGGSLGNLFDRLYYSAVPDFIDFHINEFHWFIFNVADIFITTGVVCLIFVEIFVNKKVNNENT